MAAKPIKSLELHYTMIQFLIMGDIPWPLCLSKLWIFYTRGRIIRPDELRQTFVVRLVIRLYYKDGHKTHYLSGRAIFCCPPIQDEQRRIVRPDVKTETFQPQKSVQREKYIFKAFKMHIGTTLGSFEGKLFQHVAKYREGNTAPKWPV